MNGMLDFYQDLVGVPIVDRVVPGTVYTAVVAPTMLVVFFSGAFPAWKASRLDPLDVLSGQNEMRGVQLLAAPHLVDAHHAWALDPLQRS